MSRSPDSILASFYPYWSRPDPTVVDGPDPYGNSDPEWLGIDWGEHLASVRVDGAEVNYVEMGPPLERRASRAIVLVHGLAGCWQNWLEQLPHFADRYRVLALDLPGFGSSPAPDWEISIPAYGELLRGFCDALEVRDCVVVGNSMGGFVAAEAVVSEPDRFEKLVLVSAAGVSSSRLRAAPTAVVARMMAAAAPHAFRLQTRTFRRPRARAVAFRNLFHRPGELRTEILWESYQGGMRGDGFVAALTSLAGYDFLDRLDDVEVPTLIVWGRNDNIVPPADAAEYARLLRNSETVIFDACGHLPQVERPVRFNRLLEGFLADRG